VEPLVVGPLVVEPPPPPVALVDAALDVVAGPLVEPPASPVEDVALPPVPAVTLLLSKFEGSSASPSAQAKTSHKGTERPARRASRAHGRQPLPQESLACMANSASAAPEPWTKKRHMES
jgi:hypothetical protein